MNEIRFFYNPFNGYFIDCDVCHAITFKNKGLKDSYDSYIRGIIKDRVLYLRTYYPFDGIEQLSLVELNQKSRELLEQYTEKVKEVVAENYSLKELEIVYNATNDLLKGKITNI